MPVRSAQTSWKGTLEEGSGTVALTSSQLGTYDVSFPRRSADDAEGVTSPEELIAAAHSTCFAMQFSALLGAAGATGISLDVAADVSLGPDPAGGFRIPSIALRVRGEASGIDSDQFRSIADEAKATCPVSKALAGPEITLEITYGV
ncbi:OsmC family peroxiredoxin [Paraoerskovia marina]|uniref:Osmotically inducible protein OsmC n=1 Tax=Paraoerskovia marina TaxID=545619 RepID=A0A1H1PTT7_9CELL|nr:OsmC family peroxiredoxin [Paraoerskovia marina]SDS14544.1 osmotically inducible protein OsmC [Paraoerskovia marina]